MWKKKSEDNTFIIKAPIPVIKSAVGYTMDDEHLHKLKSRAIEEHIHAKAKEATGGVFGIEVRSALHFLAKDIPMLELYLEALKEEKENESR